MQIFLVALVSNHIRLIKMLAKHPFICNQFTISCLLGYSPRVYYALGCDNAQSITTTLLDGKLAMM
jgi:hypothetical protein